MLTTNNQGCRRIVVASKRAGADDENQPIEQTRSKSVTCSTLMNHPKMRSLAIANNVFTRDSSDLGINNKVSSCQYQKDINSRRGRRTSQSNSVLAFDPTMKDLEPLKDLLATDDYLTYAQIEPKSILAEFVRNSTPTESVFRNN